MYKIIFYVFFILTYLFGDSSNDGVVKKEVLDLLKAEISQKIPLQEFDINLDHWTIAWETEKESTLTIKSLTLLKDNTHFQAEIEGFNKQSTKKLSGKITYLIDVPVLNRTIQVDEEIGEEDITIQHISLDTVNQNFVLKKEKLVGLSPRSMPLKAGVPLLKQNLKAPIVVKKGSLLRVFYENKTLRVSNKGIALKDGSRDEVIPIEISTQDAKQPKKVIHAAIISSQDAKLKV
jgi:flagella basal body P-ring formation protein FlgA